MPVREFTRLSPNCDVTHRNERLGVCFHHSVAGFDETFAIMANPASRVSYHCLLDRDGTRCRLVADEHIAWHAGVSQFLGRDQCNAFLLGCAFVGDTNIAPLTTGQIASALEWLAARWKRYGWTLDRMTDHRQIAPGRKDDLNPVEWERLRAAIAAGFSA
jgi:AmpD protein